MINLTVNTQDTSIKKIIAVKAGDVIRVMSSAVPSTQSTYYPNVYIVIKTPSSDDTHIIAYDIVWNSIIHIKSGRKVKVADVADMYVHFK